MDILLKNIEHALMITVFVFVMMVLVDYVNVLSRGRLQGLAAGGRFKQYLVAALLGVLPGCLGAFMAVSLYVHGLISFGALSACMIATAGDESFVMFAMFPARAGLVHGILLAAGLASGWLIDRAVKALRITPCEQCALTEFHAEHDVRLTSLGAAIRHFRNMSLARFLFMSFTGLCLYLLATGAIGPGKHAWERITFMVILAVALFIVSTVPDHYLQDHIWKHIAREHVWKIFLWTFGALLVLDLAMKTWDVEGFVHAHMVWVLVSAALIGLIPQSGPNLVFVMMFAQGLIPLSVLLVSCIVQEGHGMLPLLSYTVRDALLIKLFKVALALAVGGTLFLFGL
jgi:hypothetical protein